MKSNSGCTVFVTGLILLAMAATALSDYCSATGDEYYYYEYIYKVVVGNINNTSDQDGYADYTYLSTTMEIGVGYEIEVYNYYEDDEDECGIWVDWNQDEDFDDAGEQINVDNSPGPGTPYTALITPPENALAGDTRMRIRITWPETPLPCGYTEFGEVEDYTINVTSNGYEGSGTAEDPYQICTAAHMNAIGAEPNDWDAYFKLMADIDLSGYDGKDGRPSFNLIGGEYTWNGHNYAGDGFTGVFDGDGHVISNFTYESPGTNCIGLFRGVEGGQIKNLGFVNPSINAADLTAAMVAVICQGAKVSGCWVQGGSVTGDDITGGLAAYTEWYVEITDSYTDITVTGGEYVGGLVGFNNYEGYITRCYATGNVSGYEDAGGFVGISREGLIEQCYATGDVTATYQTVGGFAACIADYMEINNCYARGDVTGYDYVGNFLGRNTSYTSDIIRCYATGHINGTGGLWVHGMVGRYYPDCYILEYNFFDTQTSGTTDGCAAYGRTTAQMYQQSNYIAGGWDFETPIWTIDEGTDYPKLWWQTYYFSDSYGGGTGRAKDPFLIYDANQMNAIGANPNDWDKHFKLMADIDLGNFTGTQFNIIGNDTTAFTGGFDGAGNTISNFTYGPTNSNNVGLFGKVGGEDTIIENLELTEVSINTTGDQIGAIVGKLDGATLTNCSVRNAVINASGDAGGVVGANYSGTIEECNFDGIIDGSSTIGGLVGYNTLGGTIMNCYSKGTVIGFAAVGGLVGENSFFSLISMCYSLCDVQRAVSYHMYFGGLVGANSQGTIINSYAQGSVTGGSNTGGLAGQNGNTISNCYAVGSVDGTTNVGGLVGINNDTVEHSFWDIETCLPATSSDGGIGKTTAEMKTAATFLAEGWDFNFESDNGNEDIWTIDEGLDYPELCSILGLKYGGGTGEPNNPYLIYTAAQMVTIGTNIQDWNKSFKLMADISLAAYTGTSYNVIGTSSSPMEGDGPFRGDFDGNYYSISGFSYSGSGSYKGLFGYVSEGMIKNLKIISPAITDPGYDDMTYVGPLVGYASGTDIFGCSVVGGTVEGEDYVGGLVGLSAGSSLSDCSSSASVSGVDYVGGLVGGPSVFITGVGQISNSCAHGDVLGNEYVGGFTSDSSDTTILNSYSTGAVSGANNFGGFSGYNVNGIIAGNNVLGCFWDVQSSSEPNSAAATGLETAAMQDINTFLDAGWDFVEETDNGGSDDWAMPQGGGYPILWYELTTPPPLPTFAGGSGTAEDPYLIETAQQLNSIGHNSRLMDKNFKLISDIDMDGEHFYPIAERPYAFTGTFDGNNLTVSNIEISSQAFCARIGFIGYLYGTDAQIKNLTLYEPNLTVPLNLYVGSLTGMNENGTITNCHSVNANVFGWASVGGLVGINYRNSTISGCSATGDVLENDFLSPIFTGVGGLVGENSFLSEINNSFAKCNVSGQESLGGLVGNNLIYGVITNCYSQGTVTGTEDCIGGLIGRTTGGNNTQYCYSASQVSGPEDGDGIGGFTGGRMGSGSEIYTACFWNSEINPGLPGIGYGTDPNVVGKSTANMQTASIYTDASWDFVEIWTIICEGTNYPRLQWLTLLPADFLCPEGVDFLDYAYLSNHWLDTNCVLSSDCDGIDFDLSGSVDANDLKIFCDYWLQGEN